MLSRPLIGSGREPITDSNPAGQTTANGGAAAPLRSQQAEAPRDMGNASARTLVWFLVPSEDFVSGGLISICHFHAETRMLVGGSDVAVIASTYPNCPVLRKYTRFQNSMDIFSFSEVVAYFKSVEHVILQVPEYFCKDFLGQLSPSERLFLDTIPRLHVNVMLQNIDKCNPEEVQPLRTLTAEITCTTAHDRYSTQEQSDRFGIPLHHLSHFVDSYEQRCWTERQDILVLSPDQHPLRDRVIGMIARALPNLELITIDNMSYEDYRLLIAKAKWSLTFGEGLDNYFNEMALTAGVPFAVYNDRFFMPQFRELPTVYDSWEKLQTSIVGDILKLDHDEAYRAAGESIRQVLNQFYSREKYPENVRLFYDERYSYHPAEPLRLDKIHAQLLTAIARMRKKEQTRDANIANLKEGIEARDVYIPELKQEIQARDIYIAQLNEAIQARDANNAQLVANNAQLVANNAQLREAIEARDASLSWKVTAPLRLTARFVRYGITTLRGANRIKG